MMLKKEINHLCTLRCENMRLIYEHAEFEVKMAKEKEIAKQEKLVNSLIDGVCNA